MTARTASVAGARFESTIEDLAPAEGPWDVVWATHALYALQPAHISAAGARIRAAVALHQEVDCVFLSPGAPAL